MLHNKLFVFDFDNTLVRVDSKSIVIDKLTKEVQEFSTHEFCNHKIDHSKFEYDQSQFESLPMKFETNFQLLEILNKVHTKQNVDIIILTARHSPNGPEQFIKIYELNDIKIITIDKTVSNPYEEKAKIIKEQFFKNDYDEIYFWDDNQKNISAVANLKKELDTVKFNLFLVNFDIPLSCFKC